jgi:hypothetical protein
VGWMKFFTLDSGSFTGTCLSDRRIDGLSKYLSVWVGLIGASINPSYYVSVHCL